MSLVMAFIMAAWMTALRLSTLNWSAIFRNKSMFDFIIFKNRKSINYRYSLTSIKVTSGSISLV